MTAAMTTLKSVFPKIGEPFSWSVVVGCPVGVVDAGSDAEGEAVLVESDVGVGVEVELSVVEAVATATAIEVADEFTVAPVLSVT